MRKHSQKIPKTRFDLKLSYVSKPTIFQSNNLNYTKLQNQSKLKFKPHLMSIILCKTHDNATHSKKNWFKCHAVFQEFYQTRQKNFEVETRQKFET